MFHNHATPWCIYITADKLCLNKSQSTSHLSHVKLLCPPNNMVHESLGLLHTWTTSNVIVAFVYSKSWAAEAASELPHASVAKPRLMQVTELLESASGPLIQYFGRCERLSSGDWLTDWLTDCILEMDPMETWGSSLKFWNRKFIKWVKKMFCRQICYFLGRKFSYAGMY
jgi:hypothetical protein